MAATTTLGSIKRYFRSVTDPRVRGRSRHLLVDIIVLAICGVIANCDDWSDIVLFAQQRRAWFKRFLKLPRGIPSHDQGERIKSSLAWWRRPRFPREKQGLGPPLSACGRCCLGVDVA
jgi:hypothetical protein